MGEDCFEVPIFPLDVVLFPGMALPLHIFEPRYRLMTADCLADRASFGVVLAPAEGEDECALIGRVGTLARISDCERLPEGRFNLLALGMRRRARQRSDLAARTGGARRMPAPGSSCRSRLAQRTDTHA